MRIRGRDYGRIRDRTGAAPKRHGSWRRSGMVLVAATAFALALLTASPAAFATYGPPPPPPHPPSPVARLTVHPPVVAAGSSVTISAGVGPCRPRSSVTIVLVPIFRIGGPYPYHLATTIATAAGGVPPTTVTIPFSTKHGPYLVVASCTGVDGTQILVGSLEVRQRFQGPASGNSALGMWTPPNSWGTPILRSMLSLAVSSNAASMDVQGSSTSWSSPVSSGGARSVHLQLTAKEIKQVPTHTWGLWVGAAIVLILCLLSSILITRRLRRLGSPERQ